MTKIILNFLLKISFFPDIKSFSLHYVFYVWLILYDIFCFVKLKNYFFNVF